MALAIQTMTQTERKEVIAIMQESFDSQESPMVGIFLYDAGKDELFGVSAVIATDLAPLNNGKKTISLLHKTWWKKQEMRAKAKKETQSIFLKDYTQVPRGRLFQRQDGAFELMCGSWITDHIVDLVKDEFNLNDVPLEVKIDTHWELGHGWSDELV